MESVPPINRFLFVMAIIIIILFSWLNWLNHVKPPIYMGLYGIGTSNQSVPEMAIDDLLIYQI